MVDLPTPRGDRPGSLMVNNGSQRSGFESRWRHFDFLIRFFFSFHVSLSSMPTRPTVSCQECYRQSKLPAIKITDNQNLPAIKFTGNQSFFFFSCRLFQYRPRQILYCKHYRHSFYKIKLKRKEIVLLKFILINYCMYLLQAYSF